MIDNNNASKPKDGFGRKLGDKVERAGEKISEKAPDLGKKVEKLGDRIEHSWDKKGDAV